MANAAVPTHDTGMTVPKKLLWDLAPTMLREAQNRLAGSLAVGKGWPLQGAILDVSERQVSPGQAGKLSKHRRVCPRAMPGNPKGPAGEQGAVGPAAKILREDPPLCFQGRYAKRKTSKRTLLYTVSCSPNLGIRCFEHTATVSSVLTPGRFLHPTPRGSKKGGPTHQPPFLSQAALAPSCFVI